MLDDQTMRQNMFEDTIGNLMAINTALRAEIQRYTEQLDKATKAMDRWTPAVGRNGRMNVGGLVEMIVAEIERKDEALQKLKDLLTEVVSSTMGWQATDERMWTVDVQLSKQLIEDIKQALSTEQKQK